MATSRGRRGPGAARSSSGRLPERARGLGRGGRGREAGGGGRPSEASTPAGGTGGPPRRERRGRREEKVLGTGLSATDHIVALAEAASAVAPSPAQVPVGAAAPESASSEVMRPLPVPMDRARWTCPPGGVHVVVAELLSAQNETTHEPGVATLTDGVVCVVLSHRLCSGRECRDGGAGVRARVGGQRQVDLGRRRVGQRDLRTRLTEHGHLRVEPGAGVRARDLLAEERPAGRIRRDCRVDARRSEQEHLVPGMDRRRDGDLGDRRVDRGCGRRPEGDVRRGSGVTVTCLVRVVGAPLLSVTVRATV